MWWEQNGYELSNDSGLFCDKRQDNMDEAQEGEFLKKLDNRAYRETSKKCCELRATITPTPQTREK